VPILAAETEANIDLLQQAARLLTNLNDEILPRRSPLFPSASVGKHLRHCLDFYECFLRGLLSGKVDYTHRERDEKTEAHASVALRRAQQIVQGLERLEWDARRPLRIRAEETGEEQAAWSDSTVRRELQFLVSHTVHHFALIAALLRAFGEEPEAEFGVAASTLRHRREMRECLTS
jgi:uncharacterized damage-inducible protein DinB